MQVLAVLILLFPLLKFSIALVSVSQLLLLMPFSQLQLQVFVSRLLQRLTFIIQLHAQFFSVQRLLLAQVWFSLLQFISISLLLLALIEFWLSMLLPRFSFSQLHQLISSLQLIFPIFPSLISLLLIFTLRVFAFRFFLSQVSRSLFFHSRFFHFLISHFQVFLVLFSLLLIFKV